jgi:hypothetical protein
MEIVLLWLDDLDDLVFSAAHVWEALRRSVLSVGLSAACMLAVCELSLTAVHWVPVLNAIAAGCVGAWFLGGALRAFYYRLRPSALPA